MNCGAKFVDFLELVTGVGGGVDDLDLEPLAEENGDGDGGLEGWSGVTDMKVDGEPADSGFCFTPLVPFITGCDSVEIGCSGKGSPSTGISSPLVRTMSMVSVFLRQALEFGLLLTL